MKQNMNNLVEECRKILRYNIEGYAERDIYSEVYGEISTLELIRRLRIIEEFLNNEFEDDGSMEESLIIKNRLEERISSRKNQK